MSSSIENCVVVVVAIVWLSVFLNKPFFITAEPSISIYKKKECVTMDSSLYSSSWPPSIPEQQQHAQHEQPAQPTSIVDDWAKDRSNPIPQSGVVASPPMASPTIDMSDFTLGGDFSGQSQHNLAYFKLTLPRFHKFVNIIRISTGFLRPIWLLHAITLQYNGLRLSLASTRPCSCL